MFELRTTGSIDAMLASVDRHMPQVISLKLNALWAADAERNLKAKFEDGPSARYFTSRSGGSREKARGMATPTGGILSLTGPGANIQEYGTEGLPGGVIKPKKGNWLTFRTFAPGDTTERTGQWVRLREVAIKARHPVRDSAEEALHELRIHLLEVL